jgi:hypothetical protein
LIGLLTYHIEQISAIQCIVVPSKAALSGPDKVEFDDACVSSHMLGPIRLALQHAATEPVKYSRSLKPNRLNRGHLT